MFIFCITWVIILEFIDLSKYFFIIKDPWKLIQSSIISMDEKKSILKMLLVQIHKPNK